MNEAAVLIIITPPPEFPDGPESPGSILWGEAQAIAQDVQALLLDPDPDGFIALSVAVPLYDFTGIDAAIVAMKLDRPYVQLS